MSQGVETQVADAEPEATKPLTSGASPLAWLLRRVDNNSVQELLSIGALCVLCVLVKILWLTHVDIYWDAGAKWHFVRQWSYANDFSHAVWSHHMARFGVNVPAFLVQKLLGTSASIYYVWPVTSFTIQVLFVYLLGRRVSGRTAGILAALLMIFFTGMTRSASQLLPDGLSGTAFVIAAYGFVRFHEELSAKRLRWLVVVSLSCICAYMIKESSVLLFPGVGLAVLLSRRSFKEAFVFSGALAAYAVLETLGFRLFTPYAHRLAVVQEHHGLYQSVTFVELVLNRFSKLDGPWKILFMVGAPSLIYSAFLGTKSVRLLTLFPVGFLFFLTFLVRSVHPIVQWIGFKPRYMAPIGPFLALAIGYVVADVIARLWRRFARPSWRAWPQQLAGQAGTLTLLLCAMLGVYEFQQERGSFKKHPLAELQRDAAILNDAYVRNLPIVQRAKIPRGPDAVYGPRGLNTIYAVYLDDAALAQSSVAKPGWLPDIAEAVRRPKKGDKYSYILRDSRPYEGTDALKKMVDAGCAVVVKTRARVILNEKKKLPRKCKAPSVAAIPAR